MSSQAVEATDPDPLTGALIEHAARLLAERGLAGLSLRQVAAAAGTSTMAVYTRFGSKAALLSAMYREGLHRLGAELEAVTSSAAVPGDPLADLAELGRAYRRSGLASRDLYWLIFGPRHEGPDGFVPSSEDAAAERAAFDPLVRGVRACVEAGSMRGDVERIALHLWSVVHGMVGLELSGRLPAEAARRAGAAYDEALAWAAAPHLT